MGRQNAISIDCWRIKAKFSNHVLIKLFTYTIITRNISTPSWSTVSVESIPLSFIRALTGQQLKNAKLENWEHLWWLTICINKPANEDEYFLNLEIAGWHRNIQLIALKHNLFQQAKHSKTIELNVTQMILFRSPRDLEQISVLGRQMGDRQLLIDAYKKATQAPFGHLMIDFDSHRDAKLKFCNCSGTGPSVLFVSLSNTRENLTNESTRALYVWIFC